MLNRVKQVLSAITAKITVNDRKFVAENLNQEEQKLFWGMNLPDQRHALNVAYTALNLAQNDSNINLGILKKCALLHDVGKVKGDVSTMDKIITVLAHKIAGKHAKQWGRPGKGSKLANLRHAVYIYFNHSERSAAMLQAIDECPLVIEIADKHHKAPAVNDPPELTILREADNRN